MVLATSSPVELVRLEPVSRFVCRKSADRNATLDPAARARGDGAHHLYLENMDTAQLRAEWDAKISAPTVFDPIPSHMDKP